MLEKNIYPAVVGWSILLMSFRCSWLIVLFKSSLSFLVLCLVVVSIIKTEIQNCEKFFLRDIFLNNVIPLKSYEVAKGRPIISLRTTRKSTQFLKASSLKSSAIC